MRKDFEKEEQIVNDRESQGLVRVVEREVTLSLLNEKLNLIWEVVSRLETAWVSYDSEGLSDEVKKE